MREIEFRGRRLDNGEWVYGYLVNLHSPERLFIGGWRRIGGEATVRDELFFSYKEVDSATVGQFINLPDKHGQKLYRGDIVRVYTYAGTDLELAEIVWRDKRLCFAARSIGNGIMWMLDADSVVEKVGNKWDNPELLE